MMIQEIEKDLATHGVSIMKHNEDGTAERIDPIDFYKQENEIEQALVKGEG